MRALPLTYDLCLWCLTAAATGRSRLRKPLRFQGVAVQPRYRTSLPQHRDSTGYFNEQAQGGRTGCASFLPHSIGLAFCPVKGSRGVFFAPLRAASFSLPAGVPRRVTVVAVVTTYSAGSVPTHANDPKKSCKSLELLRNFFLGSACQNATMRNH